MADEQSTKFMSGSSSTESIGYTTYHCFCSELIIALPKAIDDLPKRHQDGAHICKLDSTPAPAVVGTIVEPEAIILKLEDGFEKRYLVKCARCAMMVGYQLDQGQFEDSKGAIGPFEGALFLFAGALTSTEDVEAGKQSSSNVEGARSVAT